MHGKAGTGGHAAQGHQVFLPVLEAGGRNADDLVALAPRHARQFRQLGDQQVAIAGDGGDAVAVRVLDPCR